MKLTQISRSLSVALTICLGITASTAVRAETARSMASSAAPEVASPPEEVRRWDDWIGRVVDGGGNALNLVAAGGVDVLILRPMGAFATLAGAGLFVAAAPACLYNMSFGETWQAFVGAPAGYTFQRPLGRF